MKNFLLFLILLTITSTFGQNKMYIWKNNVITDSMVITNDLKISFKTTGVIPTDYVAYYPFNGSANDLSGNNNNGTTNGGLTWVTDRFGQSGKAASFNGTNSYINVPNSTSLHVQYNITVALWVKTSTTQVNKAMVEKYYGTLSDHGWLVETLTNGKATFEGRDGRGSGTTIQATSGNISDNNWHLIVGKRSGNVWAIYLDGQIAGSVDVGLTAGSIESGGDLRIGASKPNSQPPGQFWNGNIDDIRIYNRALTDAEILAIFQETAN